MNIKLYALNIRQAHAFRELQVIKIHLSVISDQFLVSCFPSSLLSCVYMPSLHSSIPYIRKPLLIFTAARLYLTHPCASEGLVIETLPWAYGAHNMLWRCLMIQVSYLFSKTGCLNCIS